jgi:hypothetical protein
MSKFKNIVFVLIAVFTFCVAVTASASANEWLWNGAPVTTALAVSIAGELLLEDMETGTAVLCSGKFEGTIEEGNKDLITGVEGLKGERTDLSGLTEPIECVWETAGLCETAMLPLVLPINLDWLTLLDLISSTLWIDLITEGETTTGGAALPGYTVLNCLVAGFEVTDTCVGPTGADLKNTETDIEAEFLENDETVTEAGNCKGTTTKLGLLNSDGPALMTHNGGGTLQLS